MVKLTGPMLAQNAAGGLAQTLIFAQSKGRPYAKLWKRPANPNSWGQQAMRAACQFLGAQWADISTADKATWTQRAAAANVSNFNAYQAFNFQRWRSRLGLTQIPTTDTAGSFGSFTWPTVTAISRGIRFTGTITDPRQAWAILFTQTDNLGDPLRWDGLRHITSILTGSTYEWIWRPLPAGVYNLRTTVMKKHGHLYLTGITHQVTVL